MFWKKNPSDEPQSSKSQLDKSAQSSRLGAGSLEASKTSGSLSSSDPLVSTGEVKSAQTSVAPSDKSTHSASSPEDLLVERFGKIRSALGSGTVIQGKLSFDTPVRIDGKLSGEVFSSKALIVGPTGQIDAQIDAAVLIVMGKVTGEIRAKQRVEVWQSGQLEGSVKTPILVLEEGCVFSGSCEMLSAQKLSSAEDAKLGEISPKITGDTASNQSNKTVPTKSAGAKTEKPASQISAVPV